MPEVKIFVGGREFEVACQEGEEHFLHAAAKLLDTEADTVLAQIGRLPEARMLLMAGLMLADKTAALDEKLRSAQSHGGAAPQKSGDSHEAQQITAPLLATLGAIAAEVEEMADRIEAVADA